MTMLKIMQDSRIDYEAEALIQSIHDGIVDTRRLLLVAQKLGEPDFVSLCDEAFTLTPGQLSAVLAWARAVRSLNGPMN